MNFAEVNSIRASACALTLPSVGFWHGDFTLASAAALPAVASIKLGNLTLRGAVVRDRPYAGARAVRIVGGSGGWRRTIGRRAYQNDAGVPISMVAGDAAREAGESVSVTANAVLGAAFTRPEGAASAVLWMLSGSWWMTPAGVVVIGPRDNVTPITSRFDVTKFDGGLGRTRLATEDVAAWTPGRPFSSPSIPDAQVISSVVHTMGDDGILRTEVLAA